MDETMIREAIELIQYQINIQEQCKNISHANIEAIDYEIKKYNIAIEALEKQLPKKVEIESWCPAYCPSCGRELSEDLGDGYYRYPKFLKRCPNPDCGQRLDWSE